jgi:hypothetical protein
MPISPPGLVATGQSISAAYANGIRAAVIQTFTEIYAWTANVDALGRSLTNASLVSATTVTGTNVNATTLVASTISVSAVTNHNNSNIVSVGRIGIGNASPGVLLHITGSNVSGVDAITGILLDRTYGSVGDAMDIVWGAGSGTTGLMAARMSVNATAGGVSSFIFYAQPAGSTDGYNNEVMRIVGTGGVHIKGSNVAGPDPIPGLLLDRVYGSVGDSMDIIWGSGTGMSGNRAARLSVNATAGGETSFIFYAQTGAGDGYGNEVARMGPAGLKLSSAWNGPHLILGAYHIWVDATNRLRISAGVPASDLAGSTVGSQ